MLAVDAHANTEEGLRRHTETTRKLWKSLFANKHPQAPARFPSVECSGNIRLRACLEISDKQEWVYVRRWWHKQIEREQDNWRLSSYNGWEACGRDWEKSEWSQQPNDAYRRPDCVPTLSFPCRAIGYGAYSHAAEHSPRYPNNLHLGMRLRWTIYAAIKQSWKSALLKRCYRLVKTLDVSMELLISEEIYRTQREHSYE